MYSDEIFKPSTASQLFYHTLYYAEFIILAILGAFLMLFNFMSGMVAIALVARLDETEPKDWRKKGY